MIIFDKFFRTIFLNVKVTKNVYSNFLKELKFVDNRYSVKLVLKIDTVILPDNYLLAKSRLRNLESRHDKNPELSRPANVYLKVKGPKVHCYCRLKVFPE